MAPVKLLMMVQCHQRSHKLISFIGAIYQCLFVYVWSAIPYSHWYSPYTYWHSIHTCTSKPHKLLQLWAPYINFQSRLPHICHTICCQKPKPICLCQYSKTQVFIFSFEKKLAILKENFGTCAHTNLRCQGVLMGQSIVYSQCNLINQSKTVMRKANQG